ncbi:hypothetical protein ATANTOWER_011944 [Ataeniobius toweri]|uniref:Uncharacterized protein n=1 Tax=Ataeniobius toweri TaxID=208326 RepID=A0ABU7AXH9_9TELE|nr:hypothetical protein [Ataeniobius toweri]
MSSSRPTMKEEFQQNLAYAPPTNNDLVNALISVLILRTVSNLQINAKNVFSEDTLVNIRKRLYKLMCASEKNLVIILRDNLSDIVNTVSESLYSKYGSCEKLIYAAIKHNHEFENTVIKALAVQLGIEKSEKMETPDHTSPSSTFPHEKLSGDVSVVLCCLLLRYMLNCPQKIRKLFPSNAMQERLSQMMIHQIQKTESNDEPLEKLKVATKVISRDLNKEFGTIEKLLKVAIMPEKAFDVLFLDYLQDKMKIKAKTDNIFTRIAKGIDNVLERISIWFYRKCSYRHEAMFV